MLFFLVWDLRVGEPVWTSNPLLLRKKLHVFEILSHLCIAVSYVGFFFFFPPPLGRAGSLPLLFLLVPSCGGSVYLVFREGIFSEGTFSEGIILHVVVYYLFWPGEMGSGSSCATIWTLLWETFMHSIRIAIRQSCRAVIHVFSFKKHLFSISYV